jgi:hypothetical protein
MDPTAQITFTIHVHSLTKRIHMCLDDKQIYNIKRLPECVIHLLKVGPRFASRLYQIFYETVGVERGPLSPCEDK